MGFALHKSAFRDALALRYGWSPVDLPSFSVCGKPFSVEHAISCPKGGFPILRHNEVRDFTASLLTEACSNVQVEPPLQKLTGEILVGASANREDGVRVDVAADNFRGDHQQTYRFSTLLPLCTANQRSLRYTCVWRRIKRELILTGLEK